MTLKLFMKNPYIKEFTTKISKITEKENQYLIELEKTAFYPEGGGQPTDIGLIGDSRVLHVFEENDRIIHVVDTLPSTIDKVICKIDWDRRFDFMQQHLGQHILSGAFEKLFDAHTVGFHLTETTLTIDIDKPLSNNDIETVEFYGNQIVFNDLQVSALFPDKQTLEDLPLRKQPKVDENIRIVKIDDFDCTPCCGTHPNRTGEVGMLKVKKVEKHRGGLRIYFNCGNRAFQDYSQKNNIVNSLSSTLSAKQEDILPSVEKLNESLYEMKKELINIKKELSTYEGVKLLKDADVIEGINVISTIYKDKNINDIKVLLNNIDESLNYVAFIGIEQDDKCQLLFRRSTSLNEIDVSSILKKSISLIDGKGGGSPISAQGGGKDIEKLHDSIKLAKDTLTQILSI